MNTLNEIEDLYKEQIDAMRAADSEIQTLPDSYPVNAFEAYAQAEENAGMISDAIETLKPHCDSLDRTATIEQNKAILQTRIDALYQEIDRLETAQSALTTAQECINEVIG